VEHVQQRLEQLLAEGFRGRAAIASYSGKFCLANADTGVLAVDDAPYSECQRATTSVSTRESVAFANMLAAFRKKAGTAIEVALPTESIDDADAVYPAITGALTAGEWNAAAAENNRVELRWYTAN
jgi:hypothetical protein